MKNSTTYCSISVYKFHSHNSQYAEFISQNIQFTELGHSYNYHDIKLLHITLVAMFMACPQKEFHRPSCNSSLCFSTKHETTHKFRVAAMLFYFCKQQSCSLFEDAMPHRISRLYFKCCYCQLALYVLAANMKQIT
jgi:hypothetical protein